MKGIVVIPFIGVVIWISQYLTPQNLMGVYQSVSSAATLAEDVSNRYTTKVENNILSGEYQRFYDYQHAIDRHGAATYDKVVSCIDSKGTLKQMFNPQTQRIARICEIEDRLFGVEIDESDGSLVTTFFKEKLKSLEKVIRYLNNVGYKE